MHVGDNQELLDELANLFLENYEAWMSGIEAAVTSRDFEQLAERAHSLKSAVGNLAARKAFEAALNLETAGRQGDPDGAQARWMQLVEEINKLSSGLESFVKERHHARAHRRG